MPTKGREFGDKTSMPTTWDGRDIVERLERREQFRSNVSRIFARKAVARRAGVAPGTLERIATGRVKDPRVGVLQRLVALLTRELEAEIRANEHDLEILRQSGVVSGSPQIIEIETLNRRARELLEGLK